MSAIVRVVLSGLAVWAFPFVVGMAIFAIVPTDAPLFDTIMSVALAAAAVAASYLFLRKAPTPTAMRGARVGAVWAILAVVLDAPFFIFGPAQMRMEADAYIADVGLSYLVIPVIAAGIGRALQVGRSTTTP